MTAALEGDEWLAACPGHTLPPGKDPVPIVPEAGWASGLIFLFDNPPPTEIRSPDRPAHSQSLYWLSYPAHCLSSYFCKIVTCLRVGLLRICQAFPVCSTVVYWWFMTDCCFMSDMFVTDFNELGWAHMAGESASLTTPQFCRSLSAQSSTVFH
jgi:hypothetical protein